MSITGLVPAFERVEQGFQSKLALAWMQDHWQVSVYCSAVYLLLIFLAQHWMSSRKPFALRRELILWNTALAIFSMMGVVHLMPNLIWYVETQAAHVHSWIGLMDTPITSWNIYSHGLSHTTCVSEITLPTHKHVSIWGWVFGLSKVLEFGDTAFIVLRKTPLTFLHWYHHVSVCIYTWYALTPELSPLSLWFGGMNYTVHTVMYTYYAFRANGYKLSAVISKCVTVLQILQMFIGIFVNALSWLTWRYNWHPEVSCVFRLDIFYFALTMYFSYAVLFIKFFYQRYIRKTTPSS